MKFMKFSAVIALAALLSACGGHDFEGVYETRAGSSNEALASLAQLVTGDKLEIGPDYIESQGKRTTFDDIFERESAGDRYLVFKTGENEMVWKVVDDKTLLQGEDIMNIRLVRVD